MRTQKIFLSTLFLFYFFINAMAQKGNPTGLKTESIKVWGNCGMCKKKIEKAAYSKNIIAANWNEDTKMLLIKYRFGATSSDAVQQAVAAAGYDTENFTASDEAYNKLTVCCLYNRKK
jgi:periplasmic mercuric ion binding protein